MPDECGSYSDGMTAKPDTLDLCGLKCPLPVLRTRKALRGLAPGATLTILCTDPLAGVDIPHFARSEGHTLAGQSLVEGVAIFEIVKRAGVEITPDRGAGS